MKHRYTYKKLVRVVPVVREHGTTIYRLESEDACVSASGKLTPFVERAAHFISDKAARRFALLHRFSLGS